MANRSLYSVPPPAYSLTRDSLYADIDGDGAVDLVGMTRRYSNSPPGWRSRGDGNFDALPIAFDCLVSMDFNGDQKPDCLTGATLVTGNGTPSPLPTANYNLSTQTLFWYAPYPGGAGSVPIDLNGDGRHDILRWRDAPAENVVFRSNGDGTFTQSTSFNLITGDHELQTSNGTTAFVIADFTGRGIPEILRVKHAASTASEATRNQLYVKADSAQPDQLVSVTSPTGAITSVSYVTLANASSTLGPRYTSERDAANTSIYPRLHLTLPTSVVSTLTTDSGVGTGTTSSEYSYKGLKAEWNGRGVLGFSEIRRESQGPDGNYLTNFTQYLQTHPYIGVASRSDTRRGRVNDTTATLLSTSTNIYCDKTAAAGAEVNATVTQPCPTTAKIQRPYLYRSTESGTDLSGTPLPTITTTNTFNGTGDPTNIVVTTAGTVAGLSETYTKTTANIYLPDNIAGDNWILGRLQRATVRSQAPNNFASLSVTAGTAPNATATAGVKDALSPSITPASISQTRSTAGPFSATAIVSVGGFPTPPLTYAWARVAGATSLITATPSSGSSNSTTFSANLALGQSATETFRVTVTDAAGRTGTRDIPIFFGPPPFTITVAPAAPSAARGDPGSLSTSATVTANGGIAPYTYLWTRVSGSRIALSGQTTAAASFSATLTWGETIAETFQVRVTDAVSQVRTSNVTVTLTTPAAPSVSTTPAGLTVAAPGPGTRQGNVTATAAGGTPPYTYIWSRVSGTRISVSGTQVATFSANVGWGENFSETFRVTSRDANSYTATRDVVVTFTTPSTLACSVSPSPLSASRGGSGPISASATANVSGGTAPYSVSWTRLTGSIIGVTPSGVSATFSATLAAGQTVTESFRATATDTNGFATICDVAVTLVSVYTAMTVTKSGDAFGMCFTPLTGCTATTGGVTVSVSGGEGPFTYAWSFVSGSGHTAVSPSSPTTNWTKFGGASTGGNTYTSTVRCTVTDSTGATALVDVTVTTIHTRDF